MTARIKTSKTWKKHLPQKPRRVQRGYYSEYKTKRHKKVTRIIFVLIIILLIQGIFQAKYFKIDKIELTDNKDLNQEDINNLLSNNLNTNRFFIFKNNN